ncbi:MAG: sensor histidine kinase [Almyronema sp.]
MHQVFEVNQLSWLLVGENLIISCCYFAIGSGIAYGIWRNRSNNVDSLVVTVALIFFSCAFGHGLHAVGALGLPGSFFLQTLADFATVVIALRFLSFYQSFDLLARFSQIFSSKIELENKNQLLETAMVELKQAHSQLVQREKMSSLGQLVAGIAHEINNPVNFIYGNLFHVQEYAESLLEITRFYQNHYPTPLEEAEILAAEIDLDFIQADLPRLLTSMREGSNRIRQMVLSLRSFSRMDEAELKDVNIHEGIDSTLMLLQNRLKARSERPKIEVEKDYDNLPNIECYPSALNQVFMNILVNAIDAIEESVAQAAKSENLAKPPCIKIQTALLVSQGVKISIADNGVGISEQQQQQIFDPFFTTKPIGKGSGLGMSISHQIVVEKHHGKLDCFSTFGHGTEFIIQIPLRQSQDVIG